MVIEGTIITWDEWYKNANQYSMGWQVTSDVAIT